MRYGTGKVFVNPTKEADSFQCEFGLHFLCSSNARHIMETFKGNAGLEAIASAGILHFVIATSDNGCTSVNRRRRRATI